MAVVGLNFNIKEVLLRFRGDGRGFNLWWEHFDFSILWKIYLWYKIQVIYFLLLDNDFQTTNIDCFILTFAVITYIFTLHCGRIYKRLLKSVV